ncbi:hypothetical protein [Neptuniibacter sp. QD37_11]|uniref:hypothetical protein n=1 Tax=Neptuniibacter sp. QD37_11 TaxID=3398209 RepID=UPI0039F44AD0
MKKFNLMITDNGQPRDLTVGLDFTPVTDGSFVGEKAWDIFAAGVQIGTIIKSTGYKRIAGGWDSNKRETIWGYKAKLEGHNCAGQDYPLRADAVHALIRVVALVNIDLINPAVIHEGR